MKRHSIPTLLVLSLWIAGCGQNGGETALAPSGGTTPSSNDQTSLEQNVAESPEVFEDGAYETAVTDLIPFESADGAATLDPAQGPVPDPGGLPRWQRILKERQRTVVAHIEEEAEFVKAHVRVTDRLWGVLRIFPPLPDPTAGRPDVEPFEKPFHDVAHRQALYLKRKAPALDSISAEQRESEDLAAHRSGWHLAATSHRRATPPEHTAHIQKVTILTESGGVFEVEDPLALVRFPRGLPAVAPGEVVTVVARVRDAEDLVFLFTRWGRQAMLPAAAVRLAGVPPEPGLFVGRFRAPADRRLFHVGVNALDRATLLTRDGAYDSDFWGLLVRTAPPALATGP